MTPIMDQRLGYLQFLSILFYMSLVSCKHVDNSTVVKRDFNFTSQESINDFIEIYPKCRIIDGDITIGESTKSEAINDFSSFINIRKINGFLIIRNNLSLLSLEGFNNLDTLNGVFELHGNENLVNMEGLNNLQYIRDDLSLARGTNFEQIKGLENLNHVGKLRIMATKLKSLNGLLNLKTITSGIVFYGNYNLENIEGLKNVQKVDFLQLQGCPLKKCYVPSLCKLITDAPDDVYSTSKCNFCKTGL